MESEEKPFPLIYAHRGASTLAPENTLAAFQLALLAGADGIELDVMLSRDKELVVIHDATVDRTTDGTGKVADLPMAALRELDAGARFGGDFRGEKLPTLAEVFEAVGGKMRINVELKNYAHPLDDLTSRVIALTERFQLEDSVLLSSFNPINLSKARRLNPNICRGLLVSPGDRLMLGGVGRLFPYHALHPYYEDVAPELTADLHARGKQLNTWTVDDPEALLRLRAWGVDGIICNNPSAARAVLEGR